MIDAMCSIVPPWIETTAPRGDNADVRCPCEWCRRDRLVARLIRRHARAGSTWGVAGPMLPAESPRAFLTRWGVS